MPYKRPESVLVVIYSGSEVLLLQRKDDPDFWQSVTGTMEVGETPTETAYRELAEETGVVLNASRSQIKDCHTQRQYQIRPQWQYRYAPGHTVNTEHAFYVEIERDSVITLTEHLSYIWLPKQDAIKKAWSPSNKEAIEVCVPELKR
jgi:dATP pyrophosphohydrolase